MDLPEVVQTRNRMARFLTVGNGPQVDTIAGLLMHPLAMPGLNLTRPVWDDAVMAVLSVPLEARLNNVVRAAVDDTQRLAAELGYSERAVWLLESAAQIVALNEQDLLSDDRTTEVLRSLEPLVQDE